jgi:hypothetical protein
VHGAHGIAHVSTVKGQWNVVLATTPFRFPTKFGVFRLAPLEMPTPYSTSNSHSRNGGANLFFTTFTRVLLPMTCSPFFSSWAPDGIHGDYSA